MTFELHTEFLGNTLGLILGITFGNKLNN